MDIVKLKRTITYPSQVEIKDVYQVWMGRLCEDAHAYTWIGCGCTGLTCASLVEHPVGGGFDLSSAEGAQNAIVRRA